MTDFIRIDHVQLAMPKGEEAKARQFYGGILGLNEMEKPPLLAKRGGAWFAAGTVQVHLGVEDDFRPAKKAHPAFALTDGIALRNRLATAGYSVRDDDAISDVRRFFTDDCFGNRLEFVEEAESSPAMKKKGNAA
jgi:catechol 2,3-dioxygenase-like lactoylglutathione lyase family enzyme